MRIGGSGGPDTCFLVRAESVEQAATFADRELGLMGSKLVPAWAGPAYLIGTDLSAQIQSQILRGSYVQHAFR
jgi:hypothetical protein